jgi:hypothetical protein
MISSGFFVMPSRSSIGLGKFPFTTSSSDRGFTNFGVSNLAREMAGAKGVDGVICGKACTPAATAIEAAKKEVLIIIKVVSRANDFCVEEKANVRRRVHGREQSKSEDATRYLYMLIEMASMRHYAAQRPANDPPTTRQRPASDPPATPRSPVREPLIRGSLGNNACSPSAVSA